MNWGELLRAEAALTVSVLFGVLLGEAILSTNLADRLFAPLMPHLDRWRIPRTFAQALTLSLGSPRAGAALLASAYAEGTASRDEAVFGTLCLAFPAYLRRWIATAALAISLAGLTGGLYASIILLRSAARFGWLLALLRRRNRRDAPEGTRDAGPPGRAAPGIVPETRRTGAAHRARRRRLLRTLAVSLPWAWGFFALTFALLPTVERFLLERLGGTGWLPPAGWAVTAAGLAQGTAALAAAGGAIAEGSLDVGQALLALLLGNFIGTFTRVLRQNVGYWMGIFPRELMRPLMLWHLGTLIPLSLVTILGAAAVMAAGL